ncbi:MAG: DUF177 domain-containing protein [Bacteroidaceae bacterium]|nr:DUF177 domain-containing protein [Bacteroidaceae bacterium]
MDTSSRFKIDFRDIPTDGDVRSWHLDDQFFGALDEQEIEHGNLDATLHVNKIAGAFELICEVKGEVEIPCDRCLELMTQDIEASDTLHVRIGNTREDDGDVITIPDDDPTLDVAWNLYETIALAIPISHVHPNGKCAADMTDILSHHSSQAVTDDEEPSPSDSRWEALRSLLN